MTTAHPFFMFQGQCGEALDFYVATLPETRVLSRNDKPDGTVAMARLSIAGLEIMANDSPPVHDFTFTPSISTFLGVDDPDQVDALATALSVDAKVLMPANNYGFSRRFAWVQDRFGVSWQINAA
ncbi:VOC family protein [Brevundimonas sp.]|uniref:VOC family protein n=1 Tax=Brevundimonas sp. TaxID=1871086 RepID=UPI003D1235D5